MTGAPGPHRVAFVSPLPPVRSGIADYSADLLTELEKRLDVTTFAPSEAGKAFRSGADAVLIQLGNDPMHAPSIEALLESGGRVPSVVVLHDFSLHHLYAAAYLDTGRIPEYARALERAHGEKGRLLGERALAGERVPVWDLAPWSYPMSPGVVRSADAVIVHSSLVRGALLRECPELFVSEIPHLVAPAPRTPREEARRGLKLPLDRVIAATLGVVTPAKRVGKVLEALARVPRESRPFLLVGGSVGKDDRLLEQVTELGLEEDVTFTGYLSEDDFWRAASAADVAINLRFPTVGETSGAVCRLAGSGLPVVVSDIGWFRELPDSFTSKVPVGEGEVEVLAAELSRLASDASDRTLRAEAARAWGVARSPARIAESYVRVVEAAVRGEARPQAVSSRLAAALRDVGAARSGRWGSRERGPDAELLGAVAARAAGILPVPLRAFREEDGA